GKYPSRGRRLAHGHCRRGNSPGLSAFALPIRRDASAFAWSGLLRHTGVPSRKVEVRMSSAPKIAFNSFSSPSRGVLIVFCGEGVELGTATRKALGKAADLVRRAGKAE